MQHTRQFVSYKTICAQRLQLEPEAVVATTSDENVTGWPIAKTVAATPPHRPGYIYIHLKATPRAPTIFSR